MPGGCDDEGLKKAKSGEKNTQKSSGEGFSREIKTGMPGNPTNKGGINRSTKGQ